MAAAAAVGGEDGGSSTEGGFGVADFVGTTFDLTQLVALDEHQPVRTHAEDARSRVHLLSHGVLLLACVASTRSHFLRRGSSLTSPTALPLLETTFLAYAEPLPEIQCARSGFVSSSLR